MPAMIRAIQHKGQTARLAGLATLAGLARLAGLATLAGLARLAGLAKSGSTIPGGRRSRPLCGRGNQKNLYSRAYCKKPPPKSFRTESRNTEKRRLTAVNRLTRANLQFSFCNFHFAIPLLIYSITFYSPLAPFM